MSTPTFSNWLSEYEMAVLNFRAESHRPDSPRGARLSEETRELFVWSQARGARCLGLDGGRRQLCASTGRHLGKGQESECNLARLPRLLRPLLVSRWSTEARWYLTRSLSGHRRPHQARPETA